MAVRLTRTLGGNEALGHEVEREVAALNARRTHHVARTRRRVIEPHGDVGAGGRHCRERNKDDD